MRWVTRVLSWIGGVLFGLGITFAAFAAVGGPGESGLTYATTGLVVVVGLRMVGAGAKATAIKSGASWASWTSAAFFVFILIAMPGSDTKEKGYRTQMIWQLYMIRDAEIQARKDSGRYTTKPLLEGWMPDSTPEIKLTRDGWTASIDYHRLPGATCVMFDGSEPLAPAVEPLEARCDVRVRTVRQSLPGLGLMLVGALAIGVARRLT